MLSESVPPHGLPKETRLSNLRRFKNLLTTTAKPTVLSILRPRRVFSNIARSKTSEKQSKAARKKSLAWIGGKENQRPSSLTNKKSNSRSAFKSASRRPKTVAFVETPDVIASDVDDSDIQTSKMVNHNRTIIDYIPNRPQSPKLSNLLHDNPLARQSPRHLTTLREGRNERTRMRLTFRSERKSSSTSLCLPVTPLGAEASSLSTLRGQSIQSMVPSPQPLIASNPENQSIALQATSESPRLQHSTISPSRPQSTSTPYNTIFITTPTKLNTGRKKFDIITNTHDSPSPHAKKPGSSPINIAKIKKQRRNITVIQQDRTDETAAAASIARVATDSPYRESDPMMKEVRQSNNFN